MPTYILKTNTFVADEFTEETQIIWKNLIQSLKKLELRPKKVKANRSHYFSEKYSFQKKRRNQEIDVSLELIANKSYEKYEIKFQDKSSYNGIPSIEETIEKNLQPHIYQLQEIVDLLEEKLEENLLWMLSTFVSNNTELPQKVLSILEKAINSEEKKIQITAAILMIVHDDFWRDLKPLIRLLETRIQEKKDPQEVRQQFEEAIQSVQRSKALDISCMDTDELIKHIMEDLEKERTLTEEDKKSLLEVELFLDIPNKIHHWYSERSIEVWHTEAAKYLASYEKWQETIEPYYQYLRIYDFQEDGDATYHPLGAYVIVSQFLWFHYQLKEAEKHLIRSVEFAKNLLNKEDQKKIITFKKLSTVKFDNHYAEPYYQNAQLYTLNYFYLGELYETQNLAEKAIQNYEKFLEYEPNFVAQKNIINNAYYDLVRPIPDSQQAKERIQVLKEKIN